MPVPLTLRRLLFAAARRAATDPRVQAKVRQVVNEKARPVLREKASTIRKAAGDRKPGEHPVRFMGRAFRRLLDG